MNFYDIPNDKHEQVTVLRGMKSILNDLAERFALDLAVSAHVTGTIHNEIKLIDRCLLVGVDAVKAEQYEAEAKADNRTSEQFPNV